MSWGTKILLVFAVFVTGMLFMVFKAGTFNNDLVTTDYYEQELVYQKTIQAVEQANALSAAPTFTVTNNHVLIKLPEEMNNQPITASVWLYCVANKSKDITQKFTTEDGNIRMPFLQGNKGLHEIKLSWSQKGRDYYYRHKLTL